MVLEKNYGKIILGVDTYKILITKFINNMIKNCNIGVNS